MQMQKTERRKNRPALASVVWGAAGLIIFIVFRSGSNSLFLLAGALAGLLAIWTGTTGIRRARQQAQRGRVWGIAGTVIGVVDLLVAIVLLLSPS